jgi:putative addiction module CopG family antidote
MSYILDSQSEAILQQQLSSGNFASSEEVLRAGLLLVQDHAEKLATLRAEIVEATASPERYDLDEVVEYAMDSLRQQFPQ